MPKQIQVLTMIFSQQLNPEFWDWTDAEKKNTLDVGDATAVLKHVCRRIHDGLVKSGATGDNLKFEFAGILHDRDQKEKLLLDGTTETVDVTKHVHAVITFKKKRDLNAVASWIGIAANVLEPPKRGPYGRENALAYLIHAKAPQKFQYLPTEVQTFGTFDYVAYYEENAMNWMKQAAKVRKQEISMSLELLVSKIHKGELEKRDIMKNPAYREIYANNMRAVNEAFEFQMESDSFEALEALENGEYELTVLFFTGEPGTGKTYYAQQVAKNLAQTYDWKIYEASAEHPMDKYQNEQIVLLDDLRSYSFSPSMWLQMLDPRSKASLGARYKNKNKSYRVLMITSYQHPMEFFHAVSTMKGSTEALDQFIRRVMLYVKVIRVPNGEREYLLEMVGRTGERKTISVPTPKGLQKIEIGFEPTEIYRGGAKTTATYIENIVSEKNKIDGLIRNQEPPLIGDAWIVDELHPEKTGSDDKSDQLALPLI